ncbi:hypothetical protein CY34DRAFT_19055 [Suillus luteus UH-Slu-Lm8-n1]|uniref:Unplaced genomic scaffold CY34scaffold_1114, whole genome shotgun sequence n=1 Tax=Suillus luteus UH-Slu-Lm8-n1 TaxID=930992 RepID=A0A0D0AKL4_9AGAM|nr:hypothetical protein CY34DRAFT_19055 [Suillus luteus UH-Slu-Lm8-n1]
MGGAESRYSQPKLELYGLFRALRHYRLHIIGVQNLYVKVDIRNPPIRFYTTSRSDEEISPEDDFWLDEIALFTSLSTSFLLPYKSNDLPSIFLSSADQEQTLTDIYKFLTTLEAPSFNSTAKHTKFVKQTTRSFVQKGKMYKCLLDRPPLLIIFDTDK